VNWIQLAEGVHHWNVLMKAAMIFGIPKMPTLNVKYVKLALSML